MQNLFRVTMALSALAVLTTAVQVQRDQALSEGDGKFWNLGGERFTVNQPGDYLLLRVPQDLTKIGKLVIRADMMATNSTPCGVSMKSITLYGDWMGDKVLHVGLSDGLAFKVSSNIPKFAGHWRGFKGNWTSRRLRGPEAIPLNVSLKTVAAHAKAADNKTMGPAFEIRVGDKRPFDSRAVVVVSEGASCECLEVTMANLWRLSEPNLGGLLGTEKHDQAIENITPTCAASRINMTRKEDRLRTKARKEISPHAASWTTDFQSAPSGAGPLPAAGLLGFLTVALVSVM